MTEAHPAEPPRPAPARADGRAVRWGTLRPMLGFLAPYRWRVVGASLALLLTASVTLGVGQGVRMLIDQGFAEGALDRTLVLFGVLILLLAAGTFVRFYLVSWVGERVSSDLRAAVYAHLVRLDPVFFERNAASEIQSRITADTTLLQTVIGSSVSIALRNTLMGIGGLVLMFVSNPKLSAMVMLAVPLVVAPIVLFGRRVRALSRDSQDRLADLGVRTTESLQQIKVVKAFNREDGEVARFVEHNERAFRVAERRITSRAWLTAVVMLLVFGAVAGLLYLGGHDVLTGGSSAGDLAAFIFYAVVVAGSVGALSEVVGDLQRAAGATERLLELLGAPREMTVLGVPVQPAEPVRGELEFRHVRFRYPMRPDVWVLDDVSLHVGAGETVAFVGPSGAGKSTLFELLLRFCDPEAGSVLLDGVDLRRMRPEDVRRAIAIVPQQPVLFSGSLRDNIRFGRADASDADVAAAVRAAQLEAVVDALPRGLDTTLGEFGASLSGGQRQRVAIARALLKSPRVLLLDEATSALDAESERAVQLALDAIARDRTTLIVAHRLATVRRVQRIVVMEHGHVVAAGSHEALLRDSPRYARLAALQFEHDPGVPAQSAAPAL
jgi:ATP-binding cassette subfamily B protein